MWVEFIIIVGSHSCSKGFPPQKPTLLNSNLIGNPGATGFLIARLLYATLVKESSFIYFAFAPWGGLPYEKKMGMLVVSLSRVNSDVWSRLGCSEQKSVAIF